MSKVLREQWQLAFLRIHTDSNMETIVLGISQQEEGDSFLNVTQATLSSRGGGPLLFSAEGSLKEKPFTSINEMIASTGISDGSIHTITTRMFKAGLVVRERRKIEGITKPSWFYSLPD